jgi:hypothetical protein
MARLRGHKRTTIVLSMCSPDGAPGLAFGKPEDRLCAAVASVPLQACRLLARNGHGAMSARSLLTRVKRKSDFGVVRSANDPYRPATLPYIVASARDRCDAKEESTHQSGRTS